MQVEAQGLGLVPAETVMERDREIQRLEAQLGNLRAVLAAVAGGGKEKVCNTASCGVCGGVWLGCSTAGRLVLDFLSSFVTMINTERKPQRRCHRRLPKLDSYQLLPSLHRPADRLGASQVAPLFGLTATSPRPPVPIFNLNQWPAVT